MVVSRLFALAVLVLTGCDCGEAVEQAAQDLHQHEARQLLRVAEGEREITIEAEYTRELDEGLTGPGGRPRLDRPGMRRTLKLTLFGKVGETRDELIELVRETALERERSVEQLAAMELDRIEIEHCRDRTASPRVAFRIRTRGGGAVPRAPRGWVAVWLLPEAVAPMRHEVDAPDCQAALAAFPSELGAWIRGELEGTAPVVSLHRRHVVLRGESIFAQQAPAGPRDANVAAIVATAKGIESEAVLRWMLRASEDLQVPYATDAITARVGQEPALSRAFLRELVPGESRRAGVGISWRAALAMADRVPAEVLAEVGPVARAVAEACSDVRYDVLPSAMPNRPALRTRADGECSPGQVAAVARLAARATDAGACTALAGAVPEIAAEVEPGEERAVLRRLILREVAGCASRDAIRRAALSGLTAYDYVSGPPPSACYDEARDKRLAECGDIALLGAMLLVESCSPEVVRAVRAAAPSASTDAHRRGIDCVLRACAGPEAAPSLRADCWPAAAPP